MRTLTASLVLGALLLHPIAHAQKSADGVPLAQILAAVAKKTSRKFLIDPRVQAQVMIVGQSPDDISYAELLSILQTYGFAAVESGGYTRVVPDAIIRGSAVPMMKGSHPPAQYVSAVLNVKSVSAAHLVPILRPLMPQNGHMAAMPCANALLLVDTYDNVKRLEAIIAALDTGPVAYSPEPCVAPAPGATPNPDRSR